jgi:hypothetical protein
LDVELTSAAMEGSGSPVQGNAEVFNFQRAAINYGEMHGIDIEGILSRGGIDPTDGIMGPRTAQVQAMLTQKLGVEPGTSLEALTASLNEQVAQRHAQNQVAGTPAAAEVEAAAQNEGLTVGELRAQNGPTAIERVTSRAIRG